MSKLTKNTVKTLDKVKRYGTGGAIVHLALSRAVQELPKPLAVVADELDLNQPWGSLLLGVLGPVFFGLVFAAIAPFVFLLWGLASSVATFCLFIKHIGKATQVVGEAKAQIKVKTVEEDVYTYVKIREARNDLPSHILHPKDLRPSKEEDRNILETFYD